MNTVIWFILLAIAIGALISILTRSIKPFLYSLIPVGLILFFKALDLIASLIPIILESLIWFIKFVFRNVQGITITVFAIALLVGIVTFFRRKTI
jgi:hypothetical protein